MQDRDRLWFKKEEKRNTRLYELI